jgi:cell division inhibitor SepF
MDFISGCIYTLNGSLNTISDKIFLCSPEGVDVSGDYINMVKENSFGVPTFNKMI